MLRCVIWLSVAQAVLCGGEIALAADTTTTIAGEAVENGPRRLALIRLRR